MGCRRHCAAQVMQLLNAWRSIFDGSSKAPIAAEARLCSAPECLSCFTLVSFVVSIHRCRNACLAEPQLSLTSGWYSAHARYFVLFRVFCEHCDMPGISVCGAINMYMQPATWITRPLRQTKCLSLVLVWSEGMHVRLEWFRCRS